MRPGRGIRFAITFLIVVVLVACAGPKRPEALWPAPSYTLVDQNGQRFDSSALAGKAVLMSFIYTRCVDVCPMITATMALIQEDIAKSGNLADDVVLVSISVDPGYDTPEVLRAYAAKFNVQPAGWYFLTGSPADVRRVVVDGYKLGLGEGVPTDGMAPTIVHSDRLIIQGADGQVYGVPVAAEVALDDLIKQLEAVR